MPGTFSKDNRPLLPGVYFNEEAVVPTTVLPNAGSVVAIPFTHDWGPFKLATLVSSFAEFEAKFGKSDSPGRKAVMQAFVGEGVPGYGGAGYVLCYRTGATAAAKATKALQNTTPAAAATLSAKYEGTKGNNLTVTTQDTAGDSSKNDLIILLNGVEVERFTYTDNDLNTSANSLKAQIDANSDWVTITVSIDGVALGTVTNSAFTGGNDGSTLVAGDWTALMAALEIERFGILAPYDLTDSSILTSLKTWATALNAAGRRFLTVVGGAAAETNAAAITRSTSLNDSDFVNLGQGSVRDVGVLGTSAVPVTLSTSQLAPRVAGILAQRGEAMSSTYAQLYGLELVGGAVESEKLAALKGGVVVLERDSDPVAPVHLGKVVTTYTTKTNAAKPYLIYRNAKFVRTIHGIETEFTEWMARNIIGKVVVDNKSRDAAKAELGSRLQRRVETRVIQPKPTVEIDQDPPPSDDDEFIALVYGVKFGRSAEQAFNILRVG